MFRNKQHLVEELIKPLNKMFGGSNLYTIRDMSSNRAKNLDYKRAELKCNRCKPFRLRYKVTADEKLTYMEFRQAFHSVSDHLRFREDSIQKNYLYRLKVHS